jgi:hypothetical protein
LVFISPEVVAGWKNFQNGIITQEDLSCAEQTETVFTFEAKLSGKVTRMSGPRFILVFMTTLNVKLSSIISRNTLI